MPYDLVTTRAGLEASAQRARKRADKLFGDFANFRDYCQSIAELFWPERANFTQERTPGIDMQDGLFTGDPQVFRRDLANRIGSVMRPHGREWMGLTAKPEEMMTSDPVRYWCDMVSRTQRSIVYDRKANYADTMQVGDHEYVAFGNAVSWVTYRRDGMGLVFSGCHLAKCAWAVNEEGQVDELYEKLKLTLDACVRLFGKDALPKQWRDRLRKPDGGLDEVEVIRAHFPVDPEQYEPGKRPLARMKYCILYLVGDASCRTDESPALGESFSEVFRYHVRRWMPLGEPWGRSLCTNVAMADARTLNIASMATLKSIEWAVDPPRWAEHEAVIDGVELVSGGMTYVDTSQFQGSRRDPFGVMESGDPRHAMEFLQSKRNSMALQFYETLWKLPEREMTAYETGERMEMILQDAAPVFSPMEADNARHMDIVFSLSAAKDAFPPPPEDLMRAGGKVEWDFETPVSIFLKKMRAAKARDIIENVVAGRQVNPEYGDHLNWDEMEREQWSGLGPENWVLPREKVAENRAIRAQQSGMSSRSGANGMGLRCCITPSPMLRCFRV